MGLLLFLVRKFMLINTPPRNNIVSFRFLTILSFYRRMRFVIMGGVCILRLLLQFKKRVWLEWNDWHLSLAFTAFELLLVLDFPLIWAFIDLGLTVVFFVFLFVILLRVKTICFILFLVLFPIRFIVLYVLINFLNVFIRPCLPRCFFRFLFFSLLWFFWMFLLVLSRHVLHLI